jgi:hypothetical protein
LGKDFPHQQLVFKDLNFRFSFRRI